MKIASLITDRKKLVKALEEATGLTAEYLKTPSFGYKIGPYTVNRDCTITVEDAEVDTDVLAALSVKGLIEQQEDEDVGETVISLPIADHTGRSLKNLVFMVHSKSILLSKAIGQPEYYMTSSQMTINKPFFTLKLTNTATGSTIYEKMFSFYEIEKAPTAATTSGGVMDGSTQSKVVFTTSVTDATYKATFTLGSYSGTATSSTKTLQYAIPISWCNALPNALTGTANVACQVLFGGQVYSTFQATISVSVPSSVKPTVSSFSLSDKAGTPVPSAWNLFIQHQSGAKLSAVTTAGAYSSTIQTIRLQVGTQSISKAYSASALPQIDTITQSGTLTVTVTVTDSRDRTGSKTGSVVFTPYSAPKFTQCISERCDDQGNDDNDGTYFKSTTTMEYSSCGGKNAVTMTMKYKKTDAVVFNSPVTLTPGVNICGGNLDTEFSYDVVYTVTDQFRSVSYNDYVSTAIYLMHFLHGGRGVAFGQKATIQDCVDFNWKALFRKVVSFLGIVKFGTAEADRVVMNDTTKASPIMVDPDGTGTLYAVATSKDIGAAASKAVANNLTTTAAGSVLDARQGKTLNDGKVNKAGDTMTGNLTVDRSATSGTSANVKAVGNAGAVSLLSSAGQILGVYAADDEKWVIRYDPTTGTALVPYLGITSTASGTVGSTFSEANYKYCYLKKIGKLVFMSMGLGYNTASSTIAINTTLFTIPAAYKPAEEASLVGQFTRKATSSSLNMSSPGVVKISTAGAVTQSHSSSTYCIYCFGFWETA